MTLGARRHPSPAAALFSAGRLATLLLGLALVLMACLALGVSFGERPLSMGAALGNPASLNRAIVISLRLPRALLGALVGGALACSGATLQALLQNPLADPFVLGVSGGAALGGAAAIALGWERLPSLAVGALAGLPPLLSTLAQGALSLSPIATAAFLGAVLATALVFSAGRVGGRLSPYAALLAGVIFNAIASAAITAIKTLTSPERVGALLYWLAGALGYPTFGTLTVLALVLLAAIFRMCLDASALNLLTLGDDGAAALGVEVARVRRRLFACTSLCVAAAVSLSGLIGFVGLLVPHVLRLWLGPDHRVLLPACALGGGAFLVLANLLARVLFPALGAEAPVGVITALLGGPAFLWLLHRRGVNSPIG